MGSGSCLVNKQLIAARDYAQIESNAARMIRIVREAKEAGKG